MQDVAFIGPVLMRTGFDEVQERGFSGSANACEDFDDVLSDKRGDLLEYVGRSTIMMLSTKLRYD